MKHSEETITASMDLWRLVNETKNSIKKEKSKDKIIKSLEDVPAALALLLETMGVEPILPKIETVPDPKDKEEIKSLSKQNEKLKKELTEQDKIIQVASIDNATLESKIKKLEQKPKTDKKENNTKALEKEIIELKRLAYNTAKEQQNNYDTITNGLLLEKAELLKEIRNKEGFVFRINTPSKLLIKQQKISRWKSLLAV